MDQNIHQQDICAVVVSYNPDSDFRTRIDLIRRQVCSVLIVDNGSRSDIQPILETVEAISNVSVLRNAANRGIAAALNQGAQWAQTNGYSGVIFFDQDSQVTERVLPSLIEVGNQFKPSDRVAVIGSNFKNIQSHKYFADPASTEPGAWREADVVLTSGSLISLDAYLKIGPFREEFFIDSVDSDYCYRAISKGYRIIQTLQPTMEHSAGHPTPHRFLGRTVWTVNHAPQRCYYMTRNPVVLIREYAFTHPQWAFGGTVGLAKWILKLVCFEDNRKLKLRYIALGTLHGLTNTYSTPLQ